MSICVPGGLSRRKRSCENLREAPANGGYFHPILLSFARPRLGGRGTPYDGLYGEASRGRGTVIRLQVYERVGISLVEVYQKGREIGPLGL